MREMSTFGGMSIQLVGTIAGLSRGVFSLDFAPGGEKLVVAGADSAIRIIDIYDHVPGDKARERPITPSIKYGVHCLLCVSGGFLIG